MKIKSTEWAVTLALVASSAISNLACAGTLSGNVMTDGKPLAGVMVTVIDPAAKRRETVYTNALGQYTLTVDFGGQLQMRTRLAYYKDVTQSIALPLMASKTADVTMVRHSVAAELSESLPASAHLTQLSWGSKDTREAFISQCNYCHQMGNALTRVPREESQWRSTVQRMEGYFAMLTNHEAEDITKTLAQGFLGQPVTAVERALWQPELEHVRIKEWVAGDAMTFIHDADVGADEKLYGADEGHDVVWLLDRKTGKIDEFKEPDVDLPEGGVFAGVQLPIGVFSGKHGPHSMAQAKDGKFWITNALSSTLASFDPVSKQFKLYDIGRTHLYPHTVRIDSEGIVWFTIVASNEVARFDPRTETFSIIHLPEEGFWSGVSHYLFPYILKIAAWFPKMNLQMGVNHAKWAFQGRSAFPFPYGIDVNPVDGSIWYAKLNANKIGRIDAKTQQVTEFDTPMKGPRRLRFDRLGNLWIPAFDDSAIMKFDTRASRFESFKLPLLAHNEYEVPYALNVNPETGDVWVTSNMSDRIFRFLQKEQRFVSYPLPTKVTWLRDMVFTKDHAVCSSSSNLPAYGIEGGLASFICLYPDGEAAAPKS
jgi:DNA-binding beta-propeller fold protein YncE